MKRISICLLACLAFTACSDQYSESLGLIPSLVSRYLYVSTHTLYFSSGVESNSIQIESEDTPWKIENGIEWITLSNLNGESSAQVNITVKENLNGDTARVGLFYVKANVSDWQQQFPVSVIQSAATPYINVSQTTVAMKGSANTTSVDVTANCTYQITGTTDWLSAEQKGNTLALAVTANETDQYREAAIILDHSGSLNIRTKITVSQAPASITTSTETLSFENTTGEMKVSMESEAKWTASTSYSWIDVAPTSGEAGTSQLTISVTPNSSTSSRTGYVILSIGSSKKIEIPVSQKGLYLTTDLSELSFTASQSTATLNVQSNTSWQVSSKPSWISIEKSSGTGKAELKITAEDNPYTTERSGEIVLNQPGISLQATVKVKQKGKTFDVKTTVLNFGNEQSTQSVSILTDGTWQATTNANWITLNPNTASGNSTLSITATENGSETERNGEVSITMGDATTTVAVVQEGKYFIIDNSALDFTSKGGTLNLSLSSNTTWTSRIDGDVSWLTVSPTSGKGNSTVSISATDNPSMTDRSAKVYFDAIDKNVCVVIKQKARYLTVDNSELLFYYKGRTSSAVTVSTDGQYSISCSDSWFSVNQSGNNTFTVTATSYAGTEPRTGYITLSLTDLKSGTYSIKIDVTQMNYGGSFIRKSYGEDENYDSNQTSTGTLIITGYGSDTDYDTMGKSSNTKLSISSYATDIKWDN